ADQTASDRDRGSLRFLTMRCSRDSIFLGRFIGQMIIQTILVILTLITTFIVSVYSNPTALISSLQCLLLISANLFFVLLPFTAMMALLSAAVRSPRQAMILAVLLWTLVSATLTSISQHWPIFEFLTYLIPGVHLEDLTELQPSETLSLAYIPILQTLVLLIIGRFVMTRGAV
ncbi:MAG: ABC transporter permease, partial [Pseudomonadales bacterium]|nr:ABC transporter permease [Pseudomonadales bacterium]